MTQAMVAITQSDCTGCDMCISHCPFEALLPLASTPEEMKKRPIIVVESSCVGCLSCIGSCPTDALYEVLLPPNSNLSPLLQYSSTPNVEKVTRWTKSGLGVA